MNEEPEFDHTFTYVVGFIGVLYLVGWIVVVGEAIVSDHPITLKGAISACAYLCFLAMPFTLFAIYTYIECNLKGVAKALFGEPNLWSFDSEGFSIFYVKIFMMSVGEIKIYGSPKTQNLMLALRKFLKKDITDLILSFQRNTEKLAELKKHYPWLLRLDYLFLIEVTIMFTLTPFLSYLK